MICAIKSKQTESDEISGTPSYPSQVRQRSHLIIAESHLGAEEIRLRSDDREGLGLQLPESSLRSLHHLVMLHGPGHCEHHPVARIVGGQELLHRRGSDRRDVILGTKNRIAKSAVTEAAHHQAVGENILGDSATRTKEAVVTGDLRQVCRLGVSDGLVRKVRA